MLKIVAALGAGALALLLPAQAAYADPGGSVERRLDLDFLSSALITRGKGATVAVVDSGVAGGPGLRVTGAVDLVKRKPDSMISGTLAASVIAGRSNGLATEAGVLSVRVEPDLPSKAWSRWYEENKGAALFADGIRWAADHGADVIWVRSVDRDNLIRDAVRYAVAKGVVIVTAVEPSPPRSGRGPDILRYPSGIDGVIGVASVKPDGKRDVKVSGASSAVLVSGPAEKERTSWPDGWTYWLNPQHHASAVVAAAATLIKAKYPEITPAQVARALAVSARHPDGRGAYDTAIGFGVVNPKGALDEAGKLMNAKPAASPVGPGERFEAAPPEPFDAAPPDTARLAAYGGLGAAGVALLTWASVSRRRLRRKSGSHNVDTEAGRGGPVEYPLIS
ncbi:S8 family serine peptidase [Nonomuraea sp. NN258]|uniref:S8 family peptidase n=1 Tax=Nonomuraea antri TaxID=2730852 RepID=UPI001569E852|nr:S8 family serine peptidase [Nonomuraea antri]NRQ39841.1 S8 family serine peptidase [Nonomuraea antri]